MGANSTKGKSYSAPPMPAKRLKATQDIAKRYSVGIPMTGLKANALSKPERTKANKARKLAKHVKRHPKDTQAIMGQTAAPFSAKVRHKEMLKAHAIHKANKA